MSNDTFVTSSQADLLTTTPKETQLYYSNTPKLESSDEDLHVPFVEYKYAQHFKTRGCNKDTCKETIERFHKHRKTYNLLVIVGSPRYDAKVGVILLSLAVMVLCLCGVGIYRHRLLIEKLQKLRPVDASSHKNTCGIV
eukprot:Nk52_evm25s1485 gene=Nk52_evmTU25s1485